MELVYLWVEDYKNIKKQGFNFSPRFRCEFKDKYDEDGKLKDKCELVINENKDYVSIFPENINVTAIVGENGSGKSTIKSMLNIICSRINVNLEMKYIFLISINNHIHYQSNFNFLKQSNLIKGIHNISVLTYSNSIDERTIQKQNKQLNYTD